MQTLATSINSSPGSEPAAGWLRQFGFRSWALYLLFHNLRALIELVPGLSRVANLLGTSLKQGLKRVMPRIRTNVPLVQHNCWAGQQDNSVRILGMTPSSFTHVGLRLREAGNHRVGGFLDFMPHERAAEGCIWNPEKDTIDRRARL